MPRGGEQKLLDAVLRRDALENGALIGSDKFVSHLGNEEEFQFTGQGLLGGGKSRKIAPPAQKMVKASSPDLGRNKQKGGPVSRRLLAAGRLLLMT